MGMKAEWLGTATMVLEIGGIRILTDPVLGAQQGDRYSNWGISFRAQRDQVISRERLGRIDAVLLSHDTHKDNLDRSGREFLPEASTVITTRGGAKRLGGNALGLAPFETTTIVGADGFSIRVTATPARHGPPGSLPFVGKVIGFALEWDGQTYGAVYISGDTVFFRGIDSIANRINVGTAFLHMGSARFPVVGRITFDARDAVRALKSLDPHRVIPIHHGGWSHFSESIESADQTFTEHGFHERVLWMRRGEPITIEA